MHAKVFYLKTGINEENRQLEAHNSTQAKKISRNTQLWNIHLKNVQCVLRKARDLEDILAILALMWSAARKLIYSKIKEFLKVRFL